MDERTRKIGENEARYRAVGEERSMAVVCECGGLACTRRIELEVPVYERIRADSTLFVVVPGHEIPDVESIVERHETFNVVRR